MNDKTSRPLKTFSGKDEDYPTWEVDFDTWTVRKGFDEFLRESDPRKRQRIWVGYRVTRMDDPNGEMGRWVPRESHDLYARKCKWYADKDKMLWAEVQEACQGDAKILVMQGPKYEGATILGAD